MSANNSIQKITQAMADILKEFETNLAYHFSEVCGQPFARPSWIYISLTHECTYNCKMCGVVKILKGYSLAQEAVKQVLNEIRGWREESTVVLTGGEPFLRGDIFEIIDHAAKNNVKIEAVSNGACTDENLAEKIIKSGLDNIAVSLDGACAQTHDSIRQAGSFEKAIRAIENLVRAKKSLGRGPQISVWTTIMKENVRELSEIIPLVEGLGVECLVYHPVIVAQADMQNTCKNAPFWIGAQERDTLRGQIDKIVNYQKQNGLVAFLHDPYLWLKYFDTTLKKNDWKCNPFVFLNIGPDGKIRSCGAPFGDIKEHNLEDCLKTPEAHKARNLMKQCPKPCLQTCWAYPSADSLKNIANNFTADLESAGVQDSEKKTAYRRALESLNAYEDLLRKKKKMPQLKEVIISITNRCNLKCRMCDIPLCSLGELETDLWKRILRDISQTGVQTVVFSGGEPLLREDICALVTEAKNNNMNACLTSNGYLLDDACAQKLAQAKINVVNISIEGTEATHDYLRGRGAYGRAISALKNLKKHGIETTIAATVSRYNLKELICIMELAHEIGVTTVRFQPFSRIFLKDNTPEAQKFFISKDESVKLRRDIEAIIDLSARYRIATNPVNYLRRIPGYLSEEEKLASGGCSALWTSCPVNARGDIFPCWVFAKDGFIAGNLKENNFFDIWSSSRHEQLKKQIIKTGCPRCMLSCYDENFGREFILAEFLKKGFRLLRKDAKDKIANKLVQAIKRRLYLYKYRYAFYKAYRGSVVTLAKKIFNKMFAQKDKEPCSAEVNRALRNLGEARQIIQKKMGHIK
ncbi:MAG: radical SAM protein [Candidatus Omnitrophota bacterium]